MNNLALIDDMIPAMTKTTVEKVRGLEAVLRTLPQVDIPTHHTLHGGMYARTITIPAGVVLTGVFIQVPTLLVFDGNATMNSNGEAVTISGRHVLAASAGRKQAFLAHEDTALTMVFPTNAETVEDAESEFTNEAHLLFSRSTGATNHVNITGE